MWKKGKTLAACVFAAAWWGIFYPELCFTEETCAVIENGEAQTEAIEAEKIWRATGEELVISSRLLEWCEEIIRKD